MVSSSSLRGQKVRSHAQARNLDERHAAVENDPGGIRILHQVEFHRGRLVVRVPTQPYHHDLADQIRFEQQGPLHW